MQEFTIPGKESALQLINTERQQIVEKLNEMAELSTYLPDGREEEVKNYFDKMLQMINAATTLDIISNEERDELYDKIVNFFSGMPISPFCLNDIYMHHFQNYSALDLILVYKINVQERVNEILKMYRENGCRPNLIGIDKNEYIIASRSVIAFAKDFLILNDKEANLAYKIIDQHQRGRVKEKEIIFVPKTFYEKIN